MSELLELIEMAIRPDSSSASGEQGPAGANLELTDQELGASKKVHIVDLSSEYLGDFRVTVSRLDLTAYRVTSLERFKIDDAGKIYGREPSPGLPRDDQMTEMDLIRFLKASDLKRIN